VKRFDRVVIATHADEALAPLEDPSDAERQVLGAFGYTRNEAIPHTDASLLPRARAARASWNYSVNGGGLPAISYYLNRLQRLDTARDYVVTLNHEVREEHVIGRFVYDHPLFTIDTLRAQQRLGELNARNTLYAGAYHGNGFHEDGLASGLRAAEAIA
jgi:predicted NAD/FAD-binding protein